jgi:hypothetical protein
VAESIPPAAPVKKTPPAPTAEEVAQTKEGMKKLQLSAYPSKGQSDNQVVLDERACYKAAKEQTGIDPAPILTQAPVNSDSAAQAAKKAGEEKATGAGAKGAAGGALVGAGVGAIAGNAGAGAAVGAAGGAVAGHRKKKAAGEQAEQNAQADAQAQNQAQAATIDTFKRSMSACLESKGYTVK